MIPRTPIEYEIVTAPYWSSKGTYTRRRKDQTRPRRGEVANRLRFAKASTRQYGRKGYDDDGTPIVAALVSREIKGLPPVSLTSKEIEVRMRSRLQAELEKRGLLSGIQPLPL